MTTQARFITLEGIEGVGKTTAVETVRAAVQDLGADPLVTREPGGTALGEAIRALLLDPQSAAMAVDTELLLMFAARAQHLAEVIRPALTAGRWVICDRFTDASYAYQGGGRGLPEQRIALAEELVHPDLTPDLTLLLDAPPEQALGRARARGEADRFEREEIEFFARVRAAYRERARREPTRFALIDAALPLADVSAAIRHTIAARCT